MRTTLFAFFTAAILCSCTSFDYDLTAVPIPVSAKPADVDTAHSIEPFEIETKTVLWAHGLFGRTDPDIAALVADASDGYDRIAGFRVRHGATFHDWLWTHPLGHARARQDRRHRGTAGSRRSLTTGSASPPSSTSNTRRWSIPSPRPRRLRTAFDRATSRGPARARAPRSRGSPWRCGCGFGLPLRTEAARSRSARRSGVRPSIGAPNANGTIIAITNTPNDAPQPIHMNLRPTLAGHGRTQREPDLSRDE